MKSKLDINYWKFSEFTERVKDENDEVKIAIAIKDIFKTDDFVNFEKALTTNKNFIPKFKADLKFKAGRFIDCENLIKYNDVKDFLKLVLKPRFFWQRKVNFDKLSLMEVEYVFSLFYNARPK